MSELVFEEYGYYYDCEYAGYYSQDGHNVIARYEDIKKVQSHKWKEGLEDWYCPICKARLNIWTPENIQWDDSPYENPNEYYYKPGETGNYGCMSDEDIIVKDVIE